MLKAQYTLSTNSGTVNGADKAIPSGNPFDLAYDQGYNSEDVRNVFSITTQYSPPIGRNRKFLSDLSGIGQTLLDNWSLSTSIYARSGMPIDVRLVRPDVVYVDANNNVYSSPAPGRWAIINTPGGGASRNARRPDLLPGVSPYLGNDRAYLNPAAFAIPAPGLFGNLKRGALRGPGLTQLDLALSKEFIKEKYSVAFRADFFNLFNITNFSNPAARLPNVLGIDSSQNQLQPGVGFTASAAGTFGFLNRATGNKDTFGLLDSSRQIQFSITLNMNKGQ